MSKYIDADALLKNINENVAKAHNERCAQLVEAIVYAPTADVVEVVRCKDCRWCEVTNWDGEILYGCDCCGGMNDIAPDYYCSYGERRTDDGT